MTTTQSSATARSAPPTEAWDRYRSALEGLLSEIAGGRAPGASPAAPTAGATADSEDLRRVVTEAVSAVLLESDLLSKLVTRTLKKVLAADPELIPQEAIRKICHEALRSFSSQIFGPLLKKEIEALVEKRLREFGNTEEFKGLIDSRFRALDHYLRKEVLPQMVDQALDTKQAD